MRYNIDLTAMVMSGAQLSEEITVGLFSIICEVGEGRDPHALALFDLAAFAGGLCQLRDSAGHSAGGA